MPAQAHINRIGTALPPFEAHAAFLNWAQSRIADRRDGALFKRMASRSGIEKRWTVLPPAADGDQTSPGAFYQSTDPAAPMPPTSARMAIYAEAAPDLCVAAVEALGRPEGITHIVLASCTGFIAPGIDQIVARRLGLPATVERVLIGFMGCYAAVSALRTAHHIVRSEPTARVLVITVELCTLHLQPDIALEPILAMLLFGDGAAAALVTADPVGLAISDPFAMTAARQRRADPLDGRRHGLRDASVGRGARQDRRGDRRPGVPRRARRHRRDRRLGGACRRPHRPRRGRAGICAAARGAGRFARGAARLRQYELGDADVRVRAHPRGGRHGGKPIEQGLAIAFGPGLAAEGFRFRSAA